MSDDPSPGGPRGSGDIGLDLLAPLPTEHVCQARIHEAVPGFFA